MNQPEQLFFPATNGDKIPSDVPSDTCLSARSTICWVFGIKGYFMEVKT